MNRIAFLTTRCQLNNKVLVEISPCGSHICNQMDDIEYNTATWTPNWWFKVELWQQPENWEDLQAAKKIKGAQ